MPDLIPDFFKRDLNEPEWQELEKKLEQDPGEAERLASHAEQAYLKTGLPMPQWPRGGPGLPSKKPLSGPEISSWIGLSAAVLLGTAMVLWHFWPSPSMEVPLKAALPVIPATKPIDPEAVSIASKAVPAVELNQALSPPPMAIPEKVISEGKEASTLSVVVELESPAPVTVGVYDPSGKLDRVLFTGPMSAGQWAIHWDGLLSNGQPAPSGDYRIQVRAGINMLQKSIHLETR
jgi:hypothetical protein